MSSLADDLDPLALPSTIELCKVITKPPQRRAKVQRIACKAPGLLTRYILIHKKARKESYMTLNEIEVIGNGQARAYSSTFANNYMPEFEVNLAKDFKSLRENMPWFAVDFASVRQVDSVLIRGLLGSKKVEIRVGFERVGDNYRSTLTENDLCARYDPLETKTVANQLEFVCVSSRRGKYITIQLLEFGVLGFEEATILPEPVDGGWSYSVPWSECSKSCGGGKRSAFRVCTNPAPQNGGSPCSGHPRVEETCNNQLCQGNNTTVCSTVKATKFNKRALISKF